MLDVAIFCFYIFVTALFLCGAFFVVQLIIERFIKETIPIVARLYDAIKNPENYRDK